MTIVLADGGLSWEIDVERAFQVKGRAEKHLRGSALQAWMQAWLKML